MKTKTINKIISLSLITIFILTPLSASALTKNETVFSSLNTNGNISKTTVTNHLKIKTTKELEDESELNDIINLNGSETFKQNKNILKWQTNGKDIYYQGATKKSLPLDIKIKYFLDDKEQKLENMKNKKGNVKIEITLTNKEKHVVNINGTNEEVYTPFLVMAGTTIDSKNNTDIKVTNGKVVETGNKNIIASIASPGLYESLKINELNNMNKMEISYKTENFSLNNIYIIATPKLLEENDLDLFKNLDCITSSITKLQSSMNEIENGASTLSKYTKQLSDGTNKLNKNMPNESSNKENETKLNSLKNTNNTTINTLNNANTNLENQKSQIDTKITEATIKNEYVSNQISEINTNITKAETAYNTYSSNLSEVNQGIAGLEYQISNTTDEETKEELNKQLSELKGQKETLETIVPILKNQVDAIKGTKEALKGTKASIEGTLELLNQTKTSLDTSIEANKKLATLISGNNTVVESSISTIDKMRTLSSSINKLAKGSKEINKGTNTLSQGINKFNKEGINTLNNYSNSLKRYSSKAEALIDLSKNYKGFTCNNSDETLFINKVKTGD